MEALRAVLGAPPVPQGGWEREARFVSAAALGRARPAGEPAERLAVRLRAVPGVRRVDVRPNGFLVIETAVPGEIVRDVLAEAAPGPRPVSREDAADPGRAPYVGTSGAGIPAGRAPWPDFPRTWGNPGFVVRYAYVRAGDVRRWASDLVTAGCGVAADVGEFHPESLDHPLDRAVLRVLAELPSRRERPDPGWAVYLERLAGAYHDAFEHAYPLPKGDEPFSVVHTARVWLALAVRKVLGEGLVELGSSPPGKI